jgi:hypothetical protein
VVEIKQDMSSLRTANDESSEILTKKRKKVKDFSVKALEVLEFCLKENVLRETSVSLNMSV